MFEDAIVAQLIQVATAYQLINFHLKKKLQEYQESFILSKIAEALRSEGWTMAPLLVGHFFNHLYHLMNIFLSFNFRFSTTTTISWYRSSENRCHQIRLLLFAFLLCYFYISWILSAFPFLWHLYRKYLLLVQISLSRKEATMIFMCPYKIYNVQDYFYGIAYKHHEVLQMKVRASHCTLSNQPILIFRLGLIRLLCYHYCLWHKIFYVTHPCPNIKRHQN